MVGRTSSRRRGGVWDFVVVVLGICFLLFIIDPSSYKSHASQSSLTHITVFTFYNVNTHGNCLEGIKKRLKVSYV